MYIVLRPTKYCFACGLWSHYLIISTQYYL